MVEVLGDVVHVVLESSHASKGNRHRDFRRNHIDAPVLLSHLCEFEDLLLKDGCTGFAVLSARRTLADLNAQALSFDIALVRALGGGFEASALQTASR